MLKYLPRRYLTAGLGQCNSSTLIPNDFIRGCGYEFMVVGHVAGDAQMNTEPSKVVRL